MSRRLRGTLGLVGGGGVGCVGGGDHGETEKETAKSSRSLSVVWSRVSESSTV